jgi:hypothetical protein
MTDSAMVSMNTAASANIKWGIAGTVCSGPPPTAAVRPFTSAAKL